MSSSSFDSLEKFIDASPSVFHVVNNLKLFFSSKNFVKLDLGDEWKISPNEMYYIANEGYCVAFYVPSKNWTGCRVIASHTDSPCFQIRPVPILFDVDLNHISIEEYGGTLVSSWKNRDLGVAGRIILNKDGVLHDKLINIKEVCYIPNNPVHLKEDNHPSKALAVMGLIDKSFKFENWLSEISPGFAPSEVISHDLYLYPSEPAKLIGTKQEFICAPRLDNLSSVYASAIAIANCEHDKKDRDLLMSIFYNHEEIGSVTEEGAFCPILTRVLDRIGICQGIDFRRVLHKSIIASVDVSHGQISGSTNVSEEKHSPQLGKGVVVKVHAGRAYATNGKTMAHIKCVSDRVPLQYFCKSKHGGGASLARFAAGISGIPTLDIGVPIHSMHSIREAASKSDCNYLVELLSLFMRNPVIFS